LDHLGAYLQKLGVVTNIYPLLTSKSKKYLKHKYGIKFNEKSPSLVVVGFDKELTYTKLSRACIYIQRGVPWVLVQPDIRCPTEVGFIPDAGSIGKVIELTTGVKPAAVLGKPSPGMLEEISLRSGIDASSICYVGDRLYTDIRMALESSATPILVLSGETRPEDLAASDIAKKEEILVFKDLCELLNTLKTILTEQSKHS